MKRSARLKVAEETRKMSASKREIAEQSGKSSAELLRRIMRLAAKTFADAADAARQQEIGIRIGTGSGVLTNQALGDASRRENR